MLKNAKKLYEKYKKIKITTENLKKAGKLKNSNEIWTSCENGEIR